MEEENLTEGELKKKAYLAGLRLKNSGLDAETIYARLEKQGIPEALARQVAEDVMIERRREFVKQVKPAYNFALIRIALGVFAAIISTIIFPGHIILPAGLIVGGVIYA